MGIDDFMQSIFWTQNFIATQGYNVRDNSLHQEKRSSILWEKNGKAPIIKRSRHINIRYFFITDRVKNSEVSVVWCITGDRIDDYITKPLQGAMFRNSRDQIMGLISSVDPSPGEVKLE